MCDLFSVFFLFFFFRRAYCVHGMHANREVLDVVLFQSHSKHRGKRKGGSGWKKENGAWDGRLTNFSFCFLCFLSFTHFSPFVHYFQRFFPFFLTWIPTSFFSNQSGSRGTSWELIPAEFLRRFFIYLFLFCAQQQLIFMAQPQLYSSWSIGDFVFWVSCCSA